MAIKIAPIRLRELVPARAGRFAMIWLLIVWRDPATLNQWVHSSILCTPTNEINELVHILANEKLLMQRIGSS